MNRPPPEMRAVCCQALRQWQTNPLVNEHGVARGATGPALRFAERVCAGRPLDPDEIDDAVTAHLLFDELFAQTGDPAGLLLSRDLWGGDPGRKWADHAETHAHGPVPVAAAITAAARPDVGELLSRDLAEIDRLITELIAAIAEQALDVALTQAGRRVTAALGKAKLKRSLGGGDALPPIVASIRELDDPTAAVAQVPARVWSALTAELGVTEDELLRNVFDQLGVTVGEKIDASQREIIEAIAARLGVPVSVVAELWPVERRNQLRDLAVGVLISGLLEVGRSLLRRVPDPDDRDDPLRVRVPPDLIRATLQRAAGTEPVPASAGGEQPVAPAAGVPAGSRLATGVDPLDVTAAVAAENGQRVESVTVWAHRTPPGARFDPHWRLADRVWASEQERLEVCAANPAVWPHVTVYEPGDHPGCRCEWTSSLRIIDR